jgi:hypothetical protein
VADQECDDARHDRTSCQHHKAERCFACRILIQPMANGPAKPPRLLIEFIDAMPPVAVSPFADEKA